MPMIRPTKRSRRADGSIGRLRCEQTPVHHCGKPLGNVHCNTSRSFALRPETRGRGEKAWADRRIELTPERQNYCKCQLESNVNWEAGCLKMETSKVHIFFVPTTMVIQGRMMGFTDAYMEKQLDAKQVGFLLEALVGPHSIARSPTLMWMLNLSSPNWLNAEADQHASAECRIRIQITIFGSTSIRVSDGYPPMATRCRSSCY